ncbi:Serine/threonine-protein phosphatase [Fasciola hepatica]|uniref:Serine/threonine-protein phosphatase n=1 Tax=Fasciola hepatica TaxID=6192 RepID=A0A4E0RIX5_FASHE|nr:Serine/threonine-protein phosphatase [Fasciola hepatica]
MGCIGSKDDVIFLSEFHSKSGHEISNSETTEASGAINLRVSDDNLIDSADFFVGIEPADGKMTTFRAAVLIQCWYRRKVANLEVQRRCAWKVLQALEYKANETNFSEKRLSFSSISNIIKDASSLLEGQPNISRLDLQQQDSVAICGDVHGNLHAVLQFLKQIESKELIILCSRLFCRIPVACIINKAIFVCHGGIAPSTDMDRLQKLDRKKLLNLMWSDPQVDSGCRPNTFRGGGCYFGPDVTDSFIKRTGIQCIVRSHQCFPDGWQSTHSGRVITIFSSMDYYGTRSNDGVPIKAKSEAVNAVLVKLWQQILINQEAIIAACRKSDPVGRGEISLNDWSLIMSEVTKLQLPWRCLRPFLIRKGASSCTVNYVSLFEGTCLTHTQLRNEDKLLSDLLRNYDAIKSTAQLIDSDDTGTVDLKKLQSTLSVAQSHPKISGLYHLITRLIDQIDDKTVGLFNLTCFFSEFRFIEVGKRR